MYRTCEGAKIKTSVCQGGIGVSVIPGQPSARTGGLRDCSTDKLNPGSGCFVVCLFICITFFKEKKKTSWLGFSCDLARLPSSGTEETSNLGGCTERALSPSMQEPFIPCVRRRSRRRRNPFLQFRALKSLYCAVEVTTGSQLSPVVSHSN